jgi:cytohesin
MGAVSATGKAPYVAHGQASFTPIEIAVIEDLPEMVALLLRRGDVRADVASVTSALHSAAGNKRVECLQAFLAPGSPVNANSSDQCGDSPLHRAALYANLEAVQLLLSRGAVCTVRDDWGSTPLHFVCCWHPGKDAERAQMLGMFLESGGDSVMNVQDKWKRTPLHYAAFCDLPECCELLLRAGAVPSLSIRDELGETPLDTASCDQNSCQDMLVALCKCWVMVFACETCEIRFWFAAL